MRIVVSEHSTFSPYTIFLTAATGCVRSIATTASSPSVNVTSAPRPWATRPQWPRPAASSKTRDGGCLLMYAASARAPGHGPSRPVVSNRVSVASGDKTDEQLRIMQKNVPGHHECSGTTHDDDESELDVSTPVAPPFMHAMFMSPPGEGNSTTTPGPLLHPRKEALE